MCRPKDTHEPETKANPFVFGEAGYLGRKSKIRKNADKKESFRTRPNRTCRLRSVASGRAVVQSCGRGAGLAGVFASASLVSGLRTSRHCDAGTGFGRTYAGRAGKDGVWCYTGGRCSASVYTGQNVVSGAETRSQRSGRASRRMGAGKGVTCRGRARTEPAEERSERDEESAAGGAVACAGLAFRRRQRTGEERVSSGAGAGRYDSKVRVKGRFSARHRETWKDEAGKIHSLFGTFWGGAMRPDTIGGGCGFYSFISKSESGRRDGYGSGSGSGDCWGTVYWIVLRNGELCDGGQGVPKHLDCLA